jgi:acyl-coenzyme A thioesterase PaaI-like protein
MLSESETIRHRVLRALALDRTPGYHFAGHFLDLSFDRVSADAACTSLRVGPHCAEGDGNVNYGALALFADLSMAANIRAGHDLATRLALVNMTLHFTGAAISGRIEASTALQGYLVETAGRQGEATIAITAQGQRVCFGIGAFMVLNAPKGMTLHARQLRREGDADVAPLAESDLSDDERAILQRADEALAAPEGDAFLRRFWGIDTQRSTDGASGVLRNGAHVANRVGHVQGGVTMGFGMATAESALSEDWMMSAASAWFIGPCKGQSIEARSTVIHQGKLTSLLRTRVTGQGDRPGTELVTTHSRKMA